MLVLRRFLRWTSDDDDDEEDDEDDMLISWGRETGWDAYIAVTKGITEMD